MNCSMISGGNFPVRNRFSTSSNSSWEIDELREKLKLTFPLVVDAGLETYNAFGVVAIGVASTGLSACCSR